MILSTIALSSADSETFRGAFMRWRMPSIEAASAAFSSADAAVVRNFRNLLTSGGDNGCPWGQRDRDHLLLRTGCGVRNRQVGNSRNHSAVQGRFLHLPQIDNRARTIRTGIRRRRNPYQPKQTRNEQPGGASAPAVSRDQSSISASRPGCSALIW